jgi:hypothetical protein
MLVVLDDDRAGLVECAPSPRDRLRARVRAGYLDGALAAGVPPEASLVLAVRAQLLAGTRYRTDVARGVQRIMDSAAGRPGPVPVCNDRVRACSAELAELTSRLLGPGPVSAQGVARARALVTDARGPVYHRASQTDLRSSLRAAMDAL